MEPRILSIQSHVVSGYVGNKSAVFPMQLLGYDVDFVNSVQFSNHTGYNAMKGQVLTEIELSDLASGLRQNNIDTYTHMLTGYIGSPGFLKEIVTLHQRLKSVNPNLIYVCDPVLGDNGSLYVPKELIPIYKDYILPIATILVPNMFEVEILTDIKISNEDHVWQAIDCLHKKGIETICVSSANLPACDDKLCVFASSTKGSSVKLKMDIPKLPAAFTGSGDLFTALMLCYMQSSGSNLKEALEKAVAALQAVLKRTLAYTSGKEQTPRNMELRLIQSREDILNPQVDIHAEIIMGNS